MKLKTAVTAILLSSVFTISFGGCNITDFNADNLLRPPKAIGDEAEIEKIIAEKAKSNYLLKYPKNGNNRSAIIMNDLDGDKKDEAIAFFRNTDDTALIHMLVMYSDNSEWKLSSDTITEATDIDSVDFADLDSSGNLEIIVGYTTYTTNVNRLSCHKYINGKTSEVQSENNYTSFYCADFDNDGNSEIISLLLYTTENEASASMLDFNTEGNNLIPKSIVKMDPNIVKFKNVSVVDFSKDTIGLAVDGCNANEDINTQIICFNKRISQLKNPLYNEKLGNITQRSCPVVSCDIDRDNKIEMPIVHKLPYLKEGASNNVADIITWNSFVEESDALVPKLRTIANYDYSFYFKTPDKWSVNSVTAINNPTDHTTSFYKWNTNKLGEKLFEIRAFKPDEWESGKSNDNYTLITKNDKYAYAFKNINADTPVSLKDDEIKTNFITLDETTE